MKRINDRQFRHRLLHRKCWNCNVPLENDNYRFGRNCPTCNTFYAETVMFAHERKLAQERSLGHVAS